MTKIPHIKQFENYYRKQWIVQNRIDLIDNPKVQDLIPKKRKEKGGKDNERNS
jgi:hypothetical protein